MESSVSYSTLVLEFVAPHMYGMRLSVYPYAISSAARDTR